MSAEGAAPGGHELVERGDALAALGRFVEGAADPGGGVALVRGAAGLGKTALLDIAVAAARAHGVPVARAAGSELETVIPFGVVHQLVDPIVRRQPALVEEGPAARAWAVLEEGRAVDPTIHRGLDWLLADAFGERSGLVVVDDLQWVDPPSRRFVDHLAHRAGASRTAVLTASRDRTSPPSPSPSAVARSSVVDLRPLSAAGCRVVARWHLPGLDEGTVDRLRHATGGNPFLLHHALRSLDDEPGRDPTEATSADLIDFARRQLSSLPPPAVQVLELVAILGDRADLRTVAAVTGLDRRSVVAAADVLAARDLTRPDGAPILRHPLLRTAILEAMAPGHRAELHRRAALALQAGGVDHVVVGHHLLHSEPQGDERIVRSLSEAAGQARARGDPATAAAFLERAFEEPPPAALRQPLALELGEDLRHVGDHRALDQLRTALRLAPAGPTRAVALRSLLAALLTFGRLAELDDVAEGELAAIHAADAEQSMLIEAELLSAARHAVDTARWRAGRLRAWEGRVTGSTPGERLLLANLASQAALDGRDAAVTASLARAALGDGTLVCEQGADSLITYQPIWQLTAAGAYDVAFDALDAATRAAEELGSPIGHIFSTLFRSYVELAIGDLAAADRHSSDALAAAEELPSGWMALPGVVAGVIDVAIELDRLDEASQVLDRLGLDGPLPDSTAHRLLLDARARLRLARVDPEPAYADAAELVRRHEDNPVLAEHLVPCHATAALAAQHVGLAEEARAHAARNLDAARRWGAPRIVARALVTDAVTAPPDEASRQLDEAVELLVDEPAPLDRARARFHRGLVHARTGARTAAVDDLRAALDAATTLGALRLQAEAHQALRALGLRPRRGAVSGPLALTTTERRVADLAAEGLTNRRIAETLYVTPRTVETHLTSAYRKLQIRGRDELVAALPGAPEPPRPTPRR